MLPRRLDRYVIRTVVGSYLASLVFVIALFVLVNLLIDMDDYLQAAEETGVGMLELAGQLVSFYFVSIPFIFVAIAPFVTVIASMFSVTRLIGANEVVPMLFTGRSMQRVLQPVWATAVCSALAMAACWQFAIPQLVEGLHEQRQMLGGDTGSAALEQLTIKRREDEKLTFFCIRYDHFAKRIEGLALLDQGSQAGDEVLIEATAADWDEAAEVWRLVGGERRSGEQATDLTELDLDWIRPESLWRAGKAAKEVAELSYTDLLQLQELRPGLRTYVLAFHAHLTFPLANVVLLCLAIPFAVNFERGRRIERVVFSILICAAYFLTDLTCQNLGQGGHLHPIFAAWLPTIVFGSVGAVSVAGIRT